MRTEQNEAMAVDDRVMTVRGEQELVARAGHLFADVRTEFVCAAADLNTWSRPQVRPAVSSRMRASVASGIMVRKLYTPAAVADHDQRRHLLEVAAAGAQVRICAAALPYETIIIDRRVMVLAGAAVTGAAPVGAATPDDRDFSVTTAPALIDGVYALFRAAWEAADDLAHYLRSDRPQVDPESKAVLKALASGLTDEAAARLLGMSLRTYRRRVAALLRQLEADSRFQAGIHAGERGLTR